MGWSQTLNPSAVEAQSGGWSPSANATIVTNLSDGNDATTVQRVVLGQPWAQFALSTATTAPSRRTSTVTNKSKTGTTVTLTTSTAHGMTAGAKVVVAISDGNYDGIWTLTSASGSSLVYETAATGGSSGAASGSVTQFAEVPAKVRPCYRARSVSGANDPIAASYVRLRAGATGPESAVWTRNGIAGTPTTYEGPWQAASPTGAAWDQAGLDSLSLGIADVNYSTNQGSAFRWVKVWAEVAYRTVPIATVLSPVTTVTDSNQPVVTWSVADGDGEDVPMVDVRVFAKPSTWAGFNPDTAAPVASDLVDMVVGGPVYWESGSGGSLLSAWKVPTVLAAGVEHRFYVKVGKWLPTGTVWSDWSYTTAMINVTPPPAPTLGTPAWDDATQAVLMPIYGHGNMLPSSAASHEDVSTSWTVVGNATVGTTSAQALNGTRSLRFTTTEIGTGQIASPSVPAAPGVRYGVKLWVKGARSHPGQPLQAAIQFFDAADTVLASTLTDITWGSSSFVSSIRYAIAPSNTTKARLLLSNPVLLAGEEIYVDQVNLAPAETGYTMGWSDGVDGDHSIVVERSDDGGATWATLARPGVATTPGLEWGEYAADQPGVQIDPKTGQLSVQDYEAPRSSTVRYRARLATSGSGGVMLSPLSAEVSVTTGTDGEWWVKVPHNPSLNIGQARIRTGLSDEIDEPLDEYPSLDGGYTVVSGGWMAYKGSFTIRAHGAAEWNVLRQVLEWPTSVLIQDPLGGQRWVRFTRRNIAWEGTRERPARSVDVSWVETAIP